MVKGVRAERCWFRSPYAVNEAALHLLTSEGVKSRFLALNS